MSMTKHEAPKLPHESALRATVPRLGMLHVFAEAQNPLSRTEVLERPGKTTMVQLRGECPDCVRRTTKTPR